MVGFSSASSSSSRRGEAAAAAEAGEAAAAGGEEEEEEEEVLKRDEKVEDCFPNMMDCQESLFAQIMALDVFPDCHFVFSGFHAGMGRTSFGSNCRMKADLMLCREEEGRNVLDFYNYHGIQFHNENLHLENCPKRADGSPFMSGNTKTRESDEEKTNYAASLTEAARLAGVNLVVKYSFVYECDFLHSGPTVCRKSGLAHVSPRRLLLEEYREDCVVGFGNLKKFTKDWLLNKILKNDPNSGGSNDFGGFVVVRGGRESKKDDGLLPQMMGFCHQRCGVNNVELGAYTEYQALKKFGGDYEKACLFWEAQTEKEQTLTKRSFHDGGECLTFEYLKFLVERRGLRDFKIAHVLLYRHKMYLTEWIRGFLQSRHELPNNNGLASNTKKLVINSVYGFYGLEACNFPVTKIVNETTLGKKYKKVLNSGEFVQLTLLGAVGKNPELLYALTVEKPNAPIYNVNQIAACILGQSRKVFFELIYKLLTFLDPGKAEICYIDTDSCVFACNTENLRDSVRPDLLKRFDEEKDSIFEILNSETEQSGKFKVEGVFREAYFRNLKTYFLAGKVGEESEKVHLRVRSIPR